ncbi:MAG: tRNA (adenosine(37)-N6)-dimethylallyltransferase MiaA [Clostridia bacterium]|nr:tRNA (adenosine(37)-N6)-dimethylallyltransferase MiaA [Clostridia bacterium]
MNVLAIVGPTGGGKSALALALSRRLGGEIVSCDSMQVYRRMDIGTAKPTKEEQNTVPHHMIDLRDPTEPFSCADYVTEATQVIEDCRKRERLPVICGGTGLYLDALLRRDDLPENTTDDVLREELWQVAETQGKDELWQRLSQVDPVSAAKTHPNNVKRVIRALEIYHTVGIPKSELDRLSQESGNRYEACVIGLRYPDRERLYRRIDERVEKMFDMGLAEETRQLMEEGVFLINQTAAQAIGYKELLPWLRGEETLSEAKERLKLATRHYAKRQMTWFGARPYVRWLDMTENGKEKTFEEIVNNAAELFQKNRICGKI